MSERQLTARERRFVEEFLIDFNGTQAAIRAGYSKRSATPQASRLLSRGAVAEALRRHLDTLTRTAGVTSERVIGELAHVAFGDIRKLYDPETGKLRPVHQLEAEVAAQISGVDQEEIYAGKAHVGHVRKVRRHDKVKALELLCRVLSLFNDTLTLKGDFAERLVRARERARTRENIT
jgi:phage terminase small subunit